MPLRHVKLATIAGLATLVAGCDGSQNFMQAASEQAQVIARFGWWVLIVFCVAAAIVWAVLARILLRRSGSFDEHAPVDEVGKTGWIAVAGLGIPAVVFFVFFLFMFVPMRSGAMHAPMRDPDMRVVGRQWWFEAIYLGKGPADIVHVPTELHVPVGRRVDIELQTLDVIHSFWVPKLAGKEDLVPGQRNHISIAASEPGVYAGECGEFCGAQHAHMRILVVAEPPADYQKWIAAQRAPAAPPVTPEAIHGAQVFATSACAACHTIRGTDARGDIGPDLTHVGSRRFIAGGSLPNDTANLAAWITDAQSLKPGTKMRTLPQLGGADLRALVAYLQGLK